MDIEKVLEKMQQMHDKSDGARQRAFTTGGWEAINYYDGIRDTLIILEAFIRTDGKEADEKDE